jgi:xanthine/uracil permease
MPAAKAPAMPTAEASYVATAEATSRERIVMAAVMMILPIMVVSEIRIVASTIPSIGVRGVSIARITVIAIAGFTTSAHHTEQAE